MQDELEFGYSIRMLKNDEVAQVEFRFDVVCTGRMLVEALRALADQLEVEAGTTTEFEQ